MRLALFLTRLALPMLVAALAATGCGGGDKPAAQPTSDGRKAGSNCEALADAGKQARFKAPDGTTIAGVELGTGKTGVVLAHQNRSNLCEWLPFGKLLVERGYHVLAFDFAGEGASENHLGDSPLNDDVVAAAGYLHAQGVTNLVLMGASKGGTAVLSAATMLTPALVAVVTLSAPNLFGGIDAAAAATKLTSPVLYLAAENDHPFAEAAQQLYDLTPATTERAIFVAIGADHGTALFAGGQPGKITEAIDKLLARQAPPAK